MDDIIAIDGPAGTGKSTIAKLIAKKIGWQYIDTGAMYRALTLACIQKNIDFDDKSDIINSANKIEIKLDNDKVFLNSCDVSDKIRTPEITDKISIIASICEVRDIMVKKQRQIGRKTASVMEGRDITSVVFPNAKYKFYLDASVDVRAERRKKEYIAKNILFDEEKLKHDIEARDNADKNRKTGALKIVKDAVIINTDNLTIEQVVEKILERIAN